MARLVVGVLCALVCAGAAQAAGQAADPAANTPPNTPPNTAPNTVADFTLIGPLADAKAIRAARPALTEPALEFTVKQTGGDGSETRTVDLAGDFTVDYGDTSGTLTDYALRRVVALDDKAKTFRNYSLYATVDFDMLETANRRYQRGALGALNLAGKTHALDAYWVQAELKIVDPQDGAPALVRRRAKDGSVHFLLAGQDVASYALSKAALTGAQSASLAHYLRMASGLHPAIIAEIQASGRLPARVAFAMPPMRKAPAAQWIFGAGRAVKAVYPLREGTPLDAAGEAGTLAPLVPLMQAALAGAAPGKRSAADYDAAIAGAMTKRSYFPAFILAMEKRLQYGAAAACAGSDCPTLADVVKAAGADPRTDALKTALAARGEALAGAIATLAAMKRDDLSDPWMLDDFLANTYVEAGEPVRALPLFESALRANPYIPGFYKDLGDAYRQAWQPNLAWFCYDTGRALPGGAESEVLSHITALEADIARKHPEFF
ncbi:MAG TPA: hypothetical protein VMH86_00110 [Rhizomicrobium sp.]|nr:hypothetical protein [Rhizomicrobium sp.]